MDRWPEAAAIGDGGAGTRCALVGAALEWAQRRLQGRHSTTRPCAIERAVTRSHSRHINTTGQLRVHCQCHRPTSHRNRPTSSPRTLSIITPGIPYRSPQHTLSTRPSSGHISANTCPIGTLQRPTGAGEALLCYTSLFLEIQSTGEELMARQVYPK